MQALVILKQLNLPKRSSEFLRKRKQKRSKMLTKNLTQKASYLLFLAKQQLMSQNYMQVIQEKANIQMKTKKPRIIYCKTRKHLKTQYANSKMQTKSNKSMKSKIKMTKRAISSIISMK